MRRSAPSRLNQIVVLSPNSSAGRGLRNSTVMPQLRNALTNRVVVEQAKGLLRESLDVSVDRAFHVLRSYARAHGEHLTDVARRLMTERHSR